LFFDDITAAQPRILTKISACRFVNLSSGLPRRTQIFSQAFIAESEAVRRVFPA